MSVIKWNPTEEAIWKLRNHKLVCSILAPMASTNMFVIVAFLFAAHLGISQAMDYVVGDDAGWTNKNFDYQGWAKDKVFRVGDTLVFKYEAGKHNVLKVDGAAFQSCAIPKNAVPLITGNDVVTLKAPGKKWYICGVAKHCESGGQKLVINVEGPLGAVSPTPAPIPGGTNSANGVVASAMQVVFAVFIAYLMIAMA